MTYILTLDDSSTRPAAEVGRKALALAQLRSQGVPVPAAFVVTTRLSDDAVSLHSGRALPLSLALSRARTLALSAPGADLRDFLRPIELPVKFMQELRDHLSSFAPGQRFAVRSSSPSEDADDVTFAGQFDTFLDRRGVQHIQDAVVECMLSQWSPRAEEYRQFHEIGGASRMAVVVQEMIDCEVAGVAFTIDPLSGKLDQIIINARRGQPDAVVSGEQPIEQFTISKDEGQEVESPNSFCNSSCLTIGDLNKLRGLATTVEQLRGFPQDIEWGFTAGQLYLLQSRPVTAIPARWTRDTLAERYPHAITPLACDILDRMFHRSLSYALRLMGLPRFGGKWISFHDHYIYGNAAASEIYSKLTRGFLKPLHDGIGGIRHLIREQSWTSEPLDHWSKNLDSYLIAAGELNCRSVSDLDAPALWAFLERIRETAYAYFTPNISISFAHSMLYSALREALCLLLGQEEGAKALVDLTLGCETKSRMFDDELRSVARVLHDDGDLRTALEERSSVDAVADLSDKSPFGTAFRQFVTRHQHREIDHFLDSYFPTLGEVPWIALEHIKTLARSDQPILDTAEENKARARRTLLSVLSSCPAEYQADLLELIELTRSYICVDDLEHYQAMRLQGPRKRAIGALGKPLAERGLIDDPLDLYFAGYGSLAEAVRSGCWDDVIDQIKQSKPSFFAASKRTPAWALEERHGIDSARAAPSHDDLQGLPCSPGRVEGTICVITGPQEFGRFQKGAVLLAKATPPAWTPLFYVAAAIVTEAGGPLSHGAITAREAGIPAVMGVKNAFDAFHDGDRVLVDGTSGRVHRIFPPQ
jgi:rifampicin phosphotransferase